MRKIYNKLVRDNIVSIIEKDHKACEYRILGQEEYLPCLYAKLDEEYKEFLENMEIEELADMEEVIRAIVLARGYSYSEFDKIREEKSQRNGAFQKKIFLMTVED